VDIPYIEFDASRAARYVKVTEVMAFRSDDGFIFLKSWGQQQLLPGGWILIPLRDGMPTGDLYGCLSEEFASTYEPSHSGAAHTYRKCVQIEAYHPGTPFAVRTVVREHVETDPAIGGAEDWVVRQPGGEVHPVADAIFRSSYRRIDAT
jgi:hypothetical protein